MQRTSREAQAARALADALLEFLIEREEAAAARARPRVTDQRPVQQRAVAPAPTEPAMPARTIEPKPPNTLLVDSKEACRLLSLGERNLWSMTAPRGPIPSVRIGRCVRFSVASLEEFVKRTEVKRR